MGIRTRSIATIKIVVPGFLIVCQAAVLVLFAQRWDAASALTVIPLWAYCLVAITLSLVCIAMLRNRLSIAAFLIWVATLVSCPDEVAGLVRCWHEAPKPGAPAPAVNNLNPLRVVTLNCRKRNVQNFELLKAWQPDIVLLQESPFRLHLTKLATELYGKDGGAVGITSWDCSIIARGKITVRQKTPHYFAQAKVELTGGRSIELISLHLQGAATSLSLHRKKTWKLHANSRRARLAQMSNIRQSILKHAPYRPCIIGGDFNSPAGDRIYFSLQQDFTDSFRTVGTGWGNTVMNKYPIHRIDQIWASTDTLRPIRSRAVPTEHSDHRMVVSDFVWK